AGPAPCGRVGRHPPAPCRARGRRPRMPQRIKCDTPIADIRVDESEHRMRPLNVLTWHVHGNYLYYLSQAPHRFYLPVREGRPEGYGGRLPGMPWPDNVIDVPAEAVVDLDLDLILYQSRKNYLED